MGSIELPKGGARCRIRRLEGTDNSLERKTLIVTIVNNDQLCMARAISVSWAKFRCSVAEWKDVAQSRGSKTNLELILDHLKVPECHYKNLCQHGQKEQTDLAKVFSRLAGVQLDRRLVSAIFLPLKTF